MSTKPDPIVCYREDSTGERCGWTGTLDTVGIDDGGAIHYCPECDWMISWNLEDN